ncbi:thiolase family protein [Desulfatitalea tepidiphila]|uniref:thiolase family protein n=1 Tax=Desulfatitalea tepidiphila TaxID=1185843 RepID=UPI0006B451CA|nr:thiolase family protein [Desulfatitalea tepidiphila]
MSDNVYIIGVGMIKFGKHLNRDVKDLTGEALREVVRDADVSMEEIEAAWFSNCMWGMYAFQHCIRGQVALSPHGLDTISIVNVENACASGSTALHSAWTAIKAGLYDCTLAIGVEKLYDEDRQKAMGSFSAGTDVEETARLIEQIKSEQKREARAEKEGAGNAGGRSVFMDFYARSARLHMAKYGTTQRQLAVIAAKAHNNSTLNPLAQYTFPMTVEQVMADREVVFPLTRAMCAPIGDGAAAAILCSERYVKKHGSGRAVRIRASVMQSGTRSGSSDVIARASKAAYEAAGLGPKDIDVAEVHDATAFGELYQYEQLGFCPEGEGGPFAESGATSLGGKIPVNTSGGLISRGHPIGASGLAMAYELTSQLRGEAGSRQVEHARIAMVENGGGTLGDGEAAVAMHIFEKGR